MSELGTNKLSDIAMELNVSPQVVSNWKSRNQVPYKYVKMLRLKLKDDINKDSKKANINSLPPEFYAFGDQNNNDEGTLTESLMPYLMLFLSNYKKILFMTLFFCISSFSYVKYIKVPLYMSVSKIVPISMVKQGQGISSIASSFGIELGSSNYSSGLTSAEMFPALITSRSLMRSLLDDKFDTEKYGHEQPLIKIILNSNGEVKKWSYKKKKQAVDELLRMISVEKKSRRSPLLTIRCVTNEPRFSAALLKSVIDKLVLKARNHKVDFVKQTVLFIKSRLKDVKLELLEKEEALKVFTESNRLIQDSPTLILERQRMSRDLEVTSSLYGSLLREYESVKIEESKLETYFEILDPPEIPSKPSNINVRRAVFRMAIFGFILSLIGIYSWDLYLKKHNKIKDLFS